MNSIYSSVTNFFGHNSPNPPSQILWKKMAKYPENRPGLVSMKTACDRVTLMGSDGTWTIKTNKFGIIDFFSLAIPVGGRGKMCQKMHPSDQSPCLHVRVSVEAFFPTNFLGSVILQAGFM
jgi:hypothetical protein